jgi:DnaD/phage-associated family protein
MSTSQPLKSQFSGFPDGKQRLVPLPEAFFTQLLLQIASLAELKTALYAFWRLDQLEGAFRYLLLEDFLGDSRWLSSLGATPRQAEVNLRLALDRLVGLGFFLQAEVSGEDGLQMLYFLNSSKGRAAVSAIAAGEWQPTGDARRPVDVRSDIPNIYRLYEDNIGAITPLIAEELREAEASYPAEWVQEAMRIAVENNVRNWRYVRAILERWKEKGRDERQNRRDTEKDRRRYADWEES